MRYTFLLFLVIACSTPNTEKQVDYYAHIEDEKARNIIQAAITKAGGIATWKNKKSLKYSKQFALLLEDGSIQKSYNQIHAYRYNPLNIDIVSVENGDTLHTVLEDGNYQRRKNDSLLDVSQAKLAKSVNSSTFVLGMPFKLLDAGAQISYLGETTFMNKTAEIIVVHYNADQHKNHSSSESWKFYFDKENANWLGYWVASSDHYNTVENLSFEQIGDLSLIKERKSYRADSLGNPLYLRADYTYGAYEISY